MARPPAHCVEKKLRVVLSVLGGELTAAEAARRHGISETSIGKWKDQFIAGGQGRPSGQGALNCWLRQRPCTGSYPATDPRISVAAPVQIDETAV